MDPKYQSASSIRDSPYLARAGSKNIITYGGIPKPISAALINISLHVILIILLKMGQENAASISANKNSHRLSILLSALGSYLSDSHRDSHT